MSFFAASQHHYAKMERKVEGLYVPFPFDHSNFSPSLGKHIPGRYSQKLLLPHQCRPPYLYAEHEEALMDSVKATMKASVGPGV